MSEQEAAFRLALRNLLDAVRDEMPTALQHDIVDHLTRTDSQGLTLCFASPLRERLLEHVCTWLARASEVYIEDERLLSLKEMLCEEKDKLLSLSVLAAAQG
jgi:hypothetical protein